MNIAGYLSTKERGAKLILAQGPLSSGGIVRFGGGGENLKKAKVHVMQKLHWTIF